MNDNKDTMICGNCSSPIVNLLLPHSLSLVCPGGLLVCLPREQAAKFCSEMKSQGSGFGGQGAVGGAWIIGIVEKGDRRARIIDKPRIIEVPPRGSPAASQDNSSTSPTPTPSHNLS